MKKFTLLVAILATWSCDTYVPRIRASQQMNQILTLCDKYGADHAWVNSHYYPGDDKSVVTITCTFREE